MKDPATILRTKYYERLTGLMYSGLFLRVADEMFDNEQQTPYVLLKDQSETQMDVFTKDLNRCTILVEIVSYGNRNKGKKEAEAVSSIIQQSIIGTPLNLGSEFQLVSTKKISTNTIFEPTDLGRVYYRKLIRFQHIINQL